jgi:hypothetical protein
MPYPNEHAVRIADPGLFDKESFRRKEIAPGISIIVAKRKGKDATETQAYRFSRTSFSIQQVKKWVKDHAVSYVTIDPASGPVDVKHSYDNIELNPHVININGIYGESISFNEIEDVPAEESEFMDVTMCMENDGFEIFDDEASDVGPEEYIDRKARVFKVCSRDGIDYDVRHLDSMVQNFVAPTTNDDWSVPIQLDHSKSSKDTVGHVRSLEHDNTWAYADLRFMGAEAVKNVKLKLWKRLSVGLRFFRNGLSMLREISVTPFPYIEDARIFSDETKGEHSMDGVTTIVGTEEPKAEVSSEIAPEEKAAEVSEQPKEEEVAKEEVAAPEAAEHSAPEQTPPETSVVNMAEALEKLSKLEADFAAKALMVEELNAKLIEKDRTIRFKECEQIVANFSDEGKTTPAMKDKELELIQSFSDDQMKLFMEVKNAQPKIVDFGVIGTTDHKAPGSTVDDVKKEASEIMSLINKKKV